MNKTKNRPIIDITALISCGHTHYPCQGVRCSLPIPAFYSYWLDTGIGLPADFYEDENDTVNFMDFGLFANVWVE